MGQKVNPISNRLGVIRGWDSNWFGGKNFGDNLVEDQKIRKYLNERLAKASISRIIIERTLKLVTITICTARPGIVIGKGGQDVDKLKEELKKLYKKDIQINIFEVKKPELDATIVGKNIATQIEHMIAYRRAIKMAVAKYGHFCIRPFCMKSTHKSCCPSACDYNSFHLFSPCHHIPFKEAVSPDRHHKVSEETSKCQVLHAAR